MGPKRNPPRPTQKLGGESLERMARVSAGEPEDREVEHTLVEPPSLGRTRTLARTVKRADLELGKGGQVDEEDWGEIEIENNDDIALGSGGVDASDTMLELTEQKSGPAHSRAITNNDPVTMALMAEVARSSKTEDFDPTHLDEVARARHGAPVGPPERPTPPRAHPHLKRRDE